MPLLEQNHPVLQNLENAIKQFSPKMFFQKQLGLVLPKGIVIKGFVGAEDSTTLRTPDGQVLHQSKQFVSLLHLALDTGRTPPSLELNPNLEAARYMQHIEGLIKHLSQRTQALIEGRPI